ncbi:Shedu immune nuclease family protein [Pseudomonas asplenii]|uniref:Shedu immune nuclease family protein n=1 Tax=Pseudomonas asplenii TaxID=53407 RepID=UPI00037DB599|nr:Shedu immune nuclease family protein [Pseudomonas fuscovaginae]
MEGTQQTSQDSWNGEDVLEPGFIVIRRPLDSGFCVDLYLQVFQKVSMEKWQSLPEDQWHHLATIEPGWITMYPVYTNPHTQRYRSNKHGNVGCIMYSHQSTRDLPDTPDDAVLYIDISLPRKLFESCNEGLGLVKHLTPLWRGLRFAPGIKTLVISDESDTSITDGAVFVSEARVDECRRTCMRITRARKKSEMSAQLHWVMSQVFPTLIPNVIFEGSRPVLASTAARRASNSIGKAAAQARRHQLREVIIGAEMLAKEAPRELFELRAEIERVTLTVMIEKFEIMLDQNLSEGHWQQFFESNLFILGMVFARPVTLLHTQFHARGSMVNGSGAHIGDLLLAQGRELAIVEIKKPSTPLMQSRPYRNLDVYGPHLQLSGAITQVLYQQGLMRSTWLSHLQDPTMRDLNPDTARCVVIAGTKPTEEGRRRSFEIFRNACKDVEVVTFDELLGKLRILAVHLSPAAPANSSDLF